MFFKERQSLQFTWELTEDGAGAPRRQPWRPLPLVMPTKQGHRPTYKQQTNEQPPTPENDISRGTNSAKDMHGSMVPGGEVRRSPEAFPRDKGCLPATTTTAARPATPSVTSQQSITGVLPIPSGAAGPEFSHLFPPFSFRTSASTQAGRWRLTGRPVSRHISNYGRRRPAR